MSLIHMRPCPVCKATTHQRYMNCLRTGTCSQSHWLCLTCNSRLSEEGELMEQGKMRQRRPLADSLNAG